MSRPWRVVTLHPDGEVDLHYGVMYEVWQARNVQRRFADQGAVIQHQKLAVDPWITVEAS